MPINFILIDCRESVEGFEHSIYSDGRKVLETFLPGVLVDRIALEEFRKRPFDFVKRYDLNAVQCFTVRK